MSEDFSVDLQLGAFLQIFLYSQIFRTPPYPTQSFANQTVIVTGSNVGLGLEAARHFYRLNCAKLILAVRTVSKGQLAKEDIVRSVKHRTDAHAIEIWPLDLTDTESVLAFANRVKKELPRIDALVENAGVDNQTWSVSEGFEQTIQVNVINTLLLATLLLPKLRETKARFADSSPHLVVVSSEAYKLTKFKEMNAPDIYERLNDEKAFDVLERYNISKLLEVLFIRELVSRFNADTSSIPPVTIDLVNPGLCFSSLDRSAGLAIQFVLFIMRSIIGRSTEVGARTLVYGACAGPNSHGEFMSDGQNQDVKEWIYEDVGKRAQKKVFEQTMKVLETRSPGVGTAIDIL